MSSESNWAAARKTAANLENFFSHLGSAREIFEEVIRAEDRLATLKSETKQAKIKRAEALGKAVEVEAQIRVAAGKATVDIEAHEARVEVARLAALEQQHANKEKLDAESAEEVRKVSATVRALSDQVAVQTENRDNLNKEIGQLTVTLDELRADLQVIKERIG